LAVSVVDESGVDVAERLLQNTT